MNIPVNYKNLLITYPLKSTMFRYSSYKGDTIYNEDISFNKGSDKKI